MIPQKTRHLILISLLFFLVFQFTACFKKPKWETNVTIPLVSKVFSVTNLIDTSDFNIWPDSSINFILSGKTDSVFLLDSIKLENLCDTTYSFLSDFLIRNFVSDYTFLNVKEVTNQPLPDTSIYIHVSPISLLFSRTLNLNNIRNVSIATCVVQLNITNGTRLYFDSVICQMNNLAPISIYAFDSLTSRSMSQRFGNFDLDSIVSFNISVFSPGTGTDSILASNRDSVTFSITFDSMRINSGSFRSVPPKIIRKSKVKIYSLPSNYAIKINELVLGAGELVVNLENNFPFYCSLQVTIPELTFDTLFTLPAFNSIECELSLANRIYHNSSDSLTPLTLQTSYGVLLDSFFINIGPEHFISVQYQVSGIEIDSLAGQIIDTISQSFSSDTININLPDFLSGVRTVNAYAMLELTNAVYFPLHMQLNIIGYNHIGNSIVLDTVLPIAAGTPTTPEHTILTIDCNEFLNFHPDFAVIDARVSSIGSGWMSRASYNTASYTITTPLRLVLQADTVSFGPDTVRISEDVRNRIRDNLKAGAFHALVQNHLPSAMSGKILLENSNFISVPINIAMPSAMVDNNGVVTTPVDTNITISLTKPEIQLFTDSIVMVTILLYIPNTDTITITARDYIKIKESYAKIETEISPK